MEQGLTKEQLDECIKESEEFHRLTDRYIEILFRDD